VLEQRTPSIAMLRGKGAVGESPVDEARIAAYRSGVTGIEPSTELRHGALADEQDQFIQVFDEIVDRADRTADAFGEGARLQPRQAGRLDRAARAFDQRLPLSGSAVCRGNDLLHPDLERRS
jgi:hypothetical protein